MDHYTSKRCLINCMRLVFLWYSKKLLVFLNWSYFYLSDSIFDFVQLLLKVEWKPESPDRFGEIAELIKSVDSLKVTETKSQGSINTLNPDLIVKHFFINFWVLNTLIICQDKVQPPRKLPLLRNLLLIALHKLKLLLLFRQRYRNPPAILLIKMVIS